MGHAARSKEVISFLLSKDHDVHIVSSHKAFAFLSKHFPGRVHEIKGLHFGFKEGKVSKRETFLLNLKKGPKNFLFNFSEYLVIEKNFHPAVVISDFESFTWAFSKLHRLPLISIDNIQVIDRCKLEISLPKEERKNYVLAKGIVKAKVPAAGKYFITSFFPIKAAKKKTSVVPPIIREAIQKTEPSPGNHILVYQSAGSPAQLKKVFAEIPERRFLIYGANKNETSGNAEFKTFSEEGFIKDFAEAEAVIANGGFSFLSEAVYLKKPAYSFPLQCQFEQFVNAAYIEKCGYGRHFKELNTKNLREFLSQLASFQKNLNRYKQNGNLTLFTQLEKLLKEINR